MVGAGGDEGGVVLPHVVLLAVDHQDALALHDDDRLLGVVVVGGVRRAGLEGGDPAGDLGGAHLFGYAAGDADPGGALQALNFFSSDDAWL